MTTARRVYYPESDGQPMGETELHVRELLRLFATLDDYYAGRPDVYVGGDLIIYFVEGDPHQSVVPDVFVALGAPKEPKRPIYKLWEERIPPTCVIEITSRSTRRTDEKRKPDVYAQMGVHEYFMYDPLDEYLNPPLQGMRLTGRTYAPILPESDGSLTSLSLGLTLELVDGRLRLTDDVTGVLLLDPSEGRDEARARATALQELMEIERERVNIERERAEIERGRAQAQEQRAEAEESARRLLEQRVAELEARLRGRDPGQ